MNRRITPQDLREFDFGNLWELKNPKFAQAPDGSQEALPQFKRRHSGSSLRGITDYLTPARLYGLRALLAWPLWLFCLVLISATIYSYRTTGFHMGQVYFSLTFVAAYLILFYQAGKSRLQRWEQLYTKTVKNDLGTHTDPVIIYDGRDMLLANERIFEEIGERPIAAFVDEYQEILAHKEKLRLEAKKAADKEKARLKKEKEDREFKEAVAEIGPLIGSGLKNLVKEGGPAYGAAKAARGNVDSNSMSSRAARAARGTTRAPDKPATSKPNYIKIEGFTGSYWETCASGLENNGNYISTRMSQIRQSNPRYTKLRAVDSNGRVVDMG